MVVRILLILLFVLGFGLLVSGAVSFWHGVPGNQIWIADRLEQARLQAGIVKGKLHLVYSRPLEQQGKSDAEADYGVVYARRVVNGQVEASGVGGWVWVPGGLLVMPPVVGFVRGPLRRRRRRKENRCLRCGYPLRGLPERRCPECGLMANG